MCFPTEEEYPDMNISSQVLGDVLSRSIQKRIEISKRMGVFLSGGNDSSLIVAIVRKFYLKKLRTLFVTFEDNPRDYGHHAQEVADRFGTDHSSVTLSPRDYVGVWADTIKVLQTPVPMPCHIGIHHALKMLSGDVDLMIDGDGADTVFGSSIWPEMIFLSRINRFIPTYLKDGIGRLAHSMSCNTTIVRIAEMIKTALNSSLYEYPHVNAAMISESEFNQIFLRGDWQQAVHFRQGFARGDFYKGLFSYLMLHGIPEDLATTVRLGLSQGIFFAYPFLDYGLLQASMRLPNKHRYHYRIRKAPLKKYSLNYFDKDFVYKPKEGFGVPLASWFTKKEFEPFLMLPLEERSLKRGWWKELELKRIIDLHRRGEGNDSSAEAIPWIVINLELWARICIDGDSPSQYK
jgi:asparagine synthase (glutamine-hydrolysing)